MTQGDPGGWTDYRLGDVISIKHGFAFRGEHFSDDGEYIVVTPGNFYEQGGFRDREGKEKYYSVAPPPEFVLDQGSVVVAMTEQAHGLLGSSAVIPVGDRYLHNQRIGLVQIEDAERIDPRFLYYLFNTQHVRDQIQATATGSKVRHTAPGRICDVQIALPALRVQIEIGEILSAYDELIENNTRRIKILEGMAQSIYKEWFVNFRYPGHENVPLVDSELGPIPEGWDTIPLSEVSELVSRGVSPKYDEDSDALVVNQKCVRDGRLSMALSRRHSSRVPEAKMLRFGDVLINSTGVGTLGRVAQVYEDLADVTADSHVTIVRPNQLLAHTDFLGLALLGLADEFASMGAGSTGQTELSRARIGAVVLAVPPRPLQGKFSEMAEPLRRLSVALAAANRNLRATRDLLLPRLVSGEIDVSDLDLSCE